MDHEVLGYKDLGVSPGLVLLSDPGHHQATMKILQEACDVLDAARALREELLPSGPWPRLSVGHGPVSMDL